MNEPVTTDRPWYWFSLRELLLWLLFAGVAAFLLNSARKGMGLLSDGEFAERVAQGDPLVQAVYDYKARTGQWPQELTAEALAGAPEPQFSWSYHWRDAVTPPELILHPIMHCYAKYRFPDYSAPTVVIENKWTISGESFRRVSVQSTASPPDRVDPGAIPAKGQNL